MTYTPLFPAAPRHYVNKFLAMESAGGILLMLSAIFAIICANTVLVNHYDLILNTKFTIGFGEDATISKALILWINDGLMAIFFFLVGMEIKRELLEGELSSVQRSLLPFVAAIGGVAAPALIFAELNTGNELAMRGWAIPTATDIAFALGLLALFGSRVPLSLKVFLTAVAVIDDLIAVCIIALFYTDSISLNSLGVAGICFVLLLFFNFRGVNRMGPYVIIGIIMWVAVLKSGVHATIAGVVLGFFIPLKVKNEHGKSMLKNTEHALHSWVAYVILPIFAFANAGIKFDGISTEQLHDPVPLGIAAGLFFGKQFGVFAASFLLIMTGLVKKPTDATWGQFYAICIMCGIGFTMSLFIGGLAYENQSALLMTETKLGVMIGSVLSGVAGYALLTFTLKKGKCTSPIDIVNGNVKSE